MLFSRLDTINMEINHDRLQLIYFLKPLKCSLRVNNNLNLLQEKPIKDTRISVINNGLNIGKITFNQITKRDLK